MKHPSLGIEDPETWIPSEALVEKYLKIKVAKEWLTVGTSEELLGQTHQTIDEMPKVRDPGGTLEAIALTQKLNIRVWIVTPSGGGSANGIRLAAIFNYGSDQEFEDILNLGGYHFVPLAKKEDARRNEMLLHREKTLRFGH